MTGNHKSEDQKGKSDRGFDYLLSALTGFAVALVSQAIADQEPSNNKTSKAEGEVAKWTKVVARWTIGLVLVGAATAAILFLQLYSFIQSERAFIAVTVTGIEGGKVAVGKPIIIQTIIYNSGRSTAFVEEAVFDTLATPKGEELSGVPNYVKGTAFNIQGPITPSTPVPSTIAITNHTGKIAILNADDVQKINSGDATIFGFGYVTYADDFSLFLGKRTIGFCARFSPHNGEAAGTFEGCGKPAYVYVR